MTGQRRFRITIPEAVLLCGALAASESSSRSETLEMRKR